MTVQVVAVEGLLEAEEPEPVEGGQPIYVGRCIGAIGIGLDAQLRKGPAHPLERGDVPTRPDLELHPCIALVDQLPHLGHERVDRGGLPAHRAELDRLSLHPEQLGQGATTGPEVDIGHGHLEGCD
jgi:hypothetical protein